MQQNQYGQSYIGNDDYRGWLNAQKANGDKLAGALLQHVGNDGKMGDPSVLDPFVFGYTKGYNSSNAADMAGYGADYAANKYQEYLDGRKSTQADADTTNANSSYNQDSINHWNAVINQNEHQLGGLQGQLDEAYKQLDSDRSVKNNELATSYNRAKSDYDTSSTKNMQSLQTSKNAIADRASQGLRGLLRMLGAMGAGGSSAALYSAPEAVTAYANRERAGVDQTFGENQQKLDTNWNNFQMDHEDEKKKLEDWYQGQRREKEKEMVERKNSLLSNLMNAYTERSSVGQGYGNKLNEITAQVNANNDRLNELNRYVAPAYTGTRANYVAPTLSSYQTGNTEVSTNANENAGQKTPALMMLLGLKDRNKETNPYGV